MDPTRSIFYFFQFSNMLKSRFPLLVLMLFKLLILCSKAFLTAVNLSRPPCTTVSMKAGSIIYLVQRLFLVVFSKSVA